MFQVSVYDGVPLYLTAIVEIGAKQDLQQRIMVDIISLRGPSLSSEVLQPYLQSSTPPSHICINISPSIMIILYHCAVLHKPHEKRSDYIHFIQIYSVLSKMKCKMYTFLLLFLQAHHQRIIPTRSNFCSTKRLSSVRGEQGSVISRSASFNSFAQTKQYTQYIVDSDANDN